MQTFDLAYDPKRLRWWIVVNLALALWRRATTIEYTRSPKFPLCNSQQQQQHQQTYHIHYHYNNSTPIMSSNHQLFISFTNFYSNTHMLWTTHSSSTVEYRPSVAATLRLLPRNWVKVIPILGSCMRSSICLRLSRSEGGLWFAKLFRGKQIPPKSDSNFFVPNTLIDLFIVLSLVFASEWIEITVINCHII